MEIKLLADEPNFIPVIASWLHSEWGHLVEGSSVEQLSKGISSKVSKTKLPVHIVAKESGNVIGFAALKLHEMEQYPEKEYWLGSLYVEQNHRGKGVGSQLIEEIISIAKKYSAKKLHLQTENLNGGLYRRLGWEALEIVMDRGDKVLVMEKQL